MKISIISVNPCKLPYARTNAHIDICTRMQGQSSLWKAVREQRAQREIDLMSATLFVFIKSVNFIYELQFVCENTCNCCVLFIEFLNFCDYHQQVFKADKVMDCENK